MNEERFKLYPAAEAVIYKTEISDKCTNCGACIGFCDIFLDSKNCAKPCLKNNGIVHIDDLDTVVDAADICPVQAISYTGVSTVKDCKRTKEALKKVIEKEICGYEFPSPDYENYKSRCRVSIRPERYSSHFDYSSRSSAESAAMDELDRAYFKKADALCAEELSEYKNTKLKPLIEYKEEDGNYYYEEEKKVNAFLFALFSEFFEITRINLLSDADYYPVKLFNRGDNPEFAKFEEKYYYLQRNVKSKDWYKTFIDIDSFRTLVEGRIAKGYLREKTMYSYTLIDAVNHIEDHIFNHSEKNLKDAFEVTWNSEKWTLDPYVRIFNRLGQKIIDMID